MRIHTSMYIFVILLSSCTATTNVALENVVQQQRVVSTEMPKSTNTNKSIYPELLKQKSKEARKLLQNVSVSPWCYKKERGRLVPKGREIALAGYRLPTNSIDIIKIRLCFQSPQNLEVLVPFYEVEWLRGNGITQFAFATKNKHTEPLILLDGKHGWEREGEVKYYFPYTDDFLYKEFVNEGFNTLISAVRSAKQTLCALGVRSRAYPDELLCEIFPDDLIINIALIEQIDDDEFINKCPSPQNLSPQNRIFQSCKEYATYKALVHYARNKNQAFSFVGSRAGAIGPMQFTRKTYLEIAIKDCPEAKLISDFETGARNLHNAIQGTICLLDRELSKMPINIRATYQANYRVGGLYPVAAYNGGLRRGVCVFENKTNKTVGRCRATKKAWQETMGYTAKYKEIWPIIDKLQTTSPITMK